jgi:hypothetical protein
MRDMAFFFAGIAVGLLWLAIWSGLLHVLRIVPIRLKLEDASTRRERLKRLGKPKYILIVGVLGSGLAFGLAMITIDLLGGHYYGWPRELIKLLFLSVLIGLSQGFWGWHNAFREPVPFPPDYPPAK